MVGISLVNVCKTCKGGQDAVRDFSLDIKDRELIIFVGPPGCGKSTTLRTIAGLEDIPSGELWMDDCLMNMVEPKNRNLSTVFQNYALYPHITVYENMAFGLRVRRIPSGETDARVREAVRILEISHLLDRKLVALSRGQKQRTAIGSVTVRKPKAYLTDEPPPNLGAKPRAQMRVEIAKLHKQLNAIITYVTHGQVEAMTLGTCIVVMNRGMIQQVAPPTEFHRSPVNKFVAGFTGSSTMNFLDVGVLEEDGIVWLLGQGWRLPLERYQTRRLKDKGYTGKQITLGIRPEDLHQEKCSGKNGSSGLNGDGSGWIGAYISVREILGSEALFHGNTGDMGQLSARMPASCRAKSGELLRPYVDMPQIKLFDIQTEENILFGQEAVMKSESLLKKTGPYGYILPALLVSAVFLFYPFFKTIYLSLYETNKMGQVKLFVGLGNYVELFESVSSYNSPAVTSLFMTIVVVGSTALGLLVAVLCNRAFPRIRIFSTTYALPMATAFSSAAMVSKITLHPPTGTMDKLLGLNINWINDPKYTLVCAALLTVWLNSGINFLYFSAGLSNIDETIYEGVSVDGANGIQKFLRLMLPGLNSIMFYTVVVNVIQAFQPFGQAEILTQGGPGEFTNLIVYSIHRDAFFNHRFGNAAAQSVILFAIIMTMTPLMFKAEKKGISY